MNAQKPSRRLTVSRPAGLSHHRMYRSVYGGSLVQYCINFEVTLVYFEN